MFPLHPWYVFHCDFPPVPSNEHTSQWCRPRILSDVSVDSPFNVQYPWWTMNWPLVCIALKASHFMGVVMVLVIRKKRGVRKLRVCLVSYCSKYHHHDFCTFQIAMMSLEQRYMVYHTPNHSCINILMHTLTWKYFRVQSHRWSTPPFFYPCLFH